MSAMYASLFPEHLKNLISMTAPVEEFPEGEMGLYSLFTSEKYMDRSARRRVRQHPGRPYRHGQQDAKARDQLRRHLRNMWERIFEEKPMETWLAMNKWVNDGPPSRRDVQAVDHGVLPAEQAGQGEMILRGRRIDLSNIRSRYSTSPVRRTTSAPSPRPRPR